MAAAPAPLYTTAPVAVAAPVAATDGDAVTGAAAAAGGYSGSLFFLSAAWHLAQADAVAGALGNDFGRTVLELMHARLAEDDEAALPRAFELGSGGTLGGLAIWTPSEPRAVDGTSAGTSAALLSAARDVQTSAGAPTALAEGPGGDEAPETPPAPTVHERAHSRPDRQPRDKMAAAASKGAKARGGAAADPWAQGR